MGNAVKNIFPIFQYSKCANVFVALHHALCALRVRPRAADRKNLPHRFPGSKQLLPVWRFSSIHSGKS
jgi:hypothetical protein